MSQNIAVVQPNREVSAPEVNPNVRMQTEPAVSFFGSATAPRFVSCGVDTAQRGVEINDRWSGVTCHLENSVTKQFDTHVAVRNQPPYPAGEGFTDGHVSLVRDPEDKTVVWITMVVNWDSLGVRKRRSLGIGRLTSTGDGSLVVQDGDLSPDRTPDITAVLGSDVEMDADYGSGPFYPTLLINPNIDPESGLHQQYIVFLQRDNTGTQPKERIGIVRRQMTHKWKWNAAQFIQPPPGLAVFPMPDYTRWVDSGSGWDVVGPGGTDGPDMVRFSRPTAAMRSDGSAIGIAFLRHSYSATTGGALDNSAFVNQLFRHFHAEYDTSTTSWGTTGIVTPPNMPAFTASSITEGAMPRLFTALPYDPIVEDISSTATRWQIALATSRATNTAGTAINWRYGTVPVTNISTYGNWSEATVFTAGGSPLLTSVFPSFVTYRMPAPANTPRYTLAFLGRVQGESNAELHAFTSAATVVAPSDLVWGLADTLTNNSVPVVGTVPWLPTSANGTSDFSWTGHWAGMPNQFYYGNYTGLTAAGTTLYFAWPDSRRFSVTDDAKHHVSIFGTRFTD